jgi:hypothetical protein
MHVMQRILRIKQRRSISLGSVNQFNCRRNKWPEIPTCNLPAEWLAESFRRPIDSGPMRLLLLITLLLFSTSAIGQSFVDTSEIYNGVLTKKRILIDANVDTTKEIYYYPNNKIQVEYFFENGKKIRWVSYTEAGKKEYEWTDPEIEHNKRFWVKSKIFIVTAILSAFMLLLMKRIRGYKTLYYSIAISLTLLLMLIFNAPGGIPEEGSIIGFALTSLLIILTALLFVLSARNLVNRLPVPKILSAFCLLASLVLGLFIIVASTVGGAGMIG